MVNSRMLHVDRATLANTISSIHLNDLLSNELLVESLGRYTIAFSHQVLFDYAVDRLLLRGTPETFLRHLINRPEMAVVVRPSLVFHFCHLWSVDPTRRYFWEVVLKIMRADEIPQIGKLVGPSVAIESASRIADLETLCLALEAPGTENRVAAEQALKHLVCALVAGTQSQVQLVGPSAGPWCELLQRIRSSLRPFVADSFRLLLSTVVERPEDLTPAQRVATGYSARRLLEFAWEQEPRDGRLVIFALQCVCRTFESDSVASTSLIERCLETKHLSQYGFEEMPWLAREVKRLICLSPSLCEQIYCAAFGHIERSTETTSVGSSRILSMTSNRRQDYEMALYGLAEEYPRFLQFSPEHSIRVLVKVINSYIAERHPFGLRHEQAREFEFAGQRACIRTDFSHSWDEGNTYADEPFAKFAVEHDILLAKVMCHS